MPQHLPHDFLELLRSYKAEFALAVDNSDRPPKGKEFVEYLTGNASHYDTVMALFHSVGLTIADKDTVRSSTQHRWQPSRVPSALKILAMSLAYHASLREDFGAFSNVDTILAQFDLIEQRLSEKWLSLHDRLIPLRC